MQYFGEKLFINKNYRLMEKKKSGSNLSCYHGKVIFSDNRACYPSVCVRVFIWTEGQGWLGATGQSLISYEIWNCRYNWTHTLIHTYTLLIILNHRTMMCLKNDRQREPRNEFFFCSYVIKMFKRKVISYRSISHYDLRCVRHSYLSLSHLLFRAAEILITVSAHTCHVCSLSRSLSNHS